MKARELTLHFDEKGNQTGIGGLLVILKSDPNRTIIFREILPTPESVQRVIEEAAKDFSSYHPERAGFISGATFALQLSSMSDKTEKTDTSKERVSFDDILKIVRDWKHSWMNQKQNSEEDFKNYYNRAFGIDSNMMHDLANKIEQKLREKGEIK